MVYLEQDRVLAPVPFVTARRFWLLSYLSLASVLTAMGLARIIGRPLAMRVLAARIDIQSGIRERLVELINLLALSVTSLKGRKIAVDTKRHRLLVDTQTQTGPEDLSAAPSGDELDEQTERGSQMVQRLGSCSAGVSSLSPTDEGAAYTDAFGATTNLKEALLDMQTSVYRKYETSSTGLPSNINKAPENILQKIKAEIRSVKGSCLSLRPH
ncbi:hypothetical protein PYCC9005_003412 [Savitreella phatthalungensis]